MAETLPNSRKGTAGTVKNSHRTDLEVTLLLHGPKSGKTIAFVLSKYSFQLSPKPFHRLWTQGQILYKKVISRALKKSKGGKLRPLGTAAGWGDRVGGA